jgi:hypothetical protein
MTSSSSYKSYKYFAEETNCCRSSSASPDCFAISIPSPDRFYSWVNESAQCLNVVRSRPVCRSAQRQQFNDITAYVDASNVYGSEQEHSALLRTYRYLYCLTRLKLHSVLTRENPRLLSTYKTDRSNRKQDQTAGLRPGRTIVEQD